ncbi:MAG: hypothetical protein IKQ27_15605 [Lachnospiraceae bacterium]|jgi:hypothetical protein|nr:hypothetical protein [Lachnospiraceae bacterium]
MKEQFIKWAEENGWDVVEVEEKADLPDHIKERYIIPETWYDFIAKFRLCQNRDFTKWFLTPLDYKNDRNEGFRWNEYEMQSLEWCDGDDQIIAFWNTHLPIFRSVDGEYSYYAIDTANGNVVYGCEPEYEDATIVADDFNAFIGQIISGKIVL